MMVLLMLYIYYIPSSLFKSHADTLVYKCKYLLSNATPEPKFNNALNSFKIRPIKNQNISEKLYHDDIA